MSNPLQRLYTRWQMARRFAGAAHSPRDYAPLFLAGIARLRPFTGSSLYARFGRLLGARIAPLIRGIRAHRLEFDLRDATDLTIFEEIFLDGIYPLERVPFTPDTVVDCGGCAGFFTVLAHSRYPAARYHVFEPNPANLARLNRNLSLNAIPATIHAAAVAQETGRALFSGEGFGGHLDAAGAGTGAFEVEVVALAAFLRDLQPRHLLLKIDIEGAEADLLPRLGEVLPPATVLFLETHHADEIWRAYLQPLLVVGFRQDEIRRRHDPVSGTDYVEHILIRV
jgi:FkbM family methyltransferase